MIRLGVNVDHIATIREARKTVEPDPVAAAFVAELAGADGITVHLREDRRHIAERDLTILKKTVRTRLNLEMATVEEIIGIALEVRPDQATLVPERREEVTTEGGLDIVANFELVAETTGRLKGAGIEVSHFVDPDAAQIRACAEAGAEAIEIHTGTYCGARTGEAIEQEFLRIVEASREADSAGLRVHAGHGLDYWNVTRICEIDEIVELNIGHAIVSRAVIVGLEGAVRDMVALIRDGEGRRRFRQ